LLDEDSDMAWIEHILSFQEISIAEKINIYGGDLENDSAIQTLQNHLSLF